MGSRAESLVAHGCRLLARPPPGSSAQTEPPRFVPSSPGSFAQDRPQVPRQEKNHDSKSRLASLRFATRPRPRPRSCRAVPCLPCQPSGSQSPNVKIADQTPERKPRRVRRPRQRGGGGGESSQSNYWASYGLRVCHVCMAEMPRQRDQKRAATNWLHALL